MEMLSHVPEKTLTGQDIFKNVNNEYIELWTKPKNGGCSQKLKVPNEIKTDKDFWIGIGLLIADGTKPGKKNKDKGRIAFTNGDPKQIKQALKIFDLFGVDRNQWKGIVSANSYYVQDEQKFISNSKQYWNENIGLNIDMISIYLYHRKPKRVRKTLENGTMQIRYSNIILHSILRNIINHN